LKWYVWIIFGVMATVVWTSIVTLRSVRGGNRLTAAATQASAESSAATEAMVRHQVTVGPSPTLAQRQEQARLQAEAARTAAVANVQIAAATAPRAAVFPWKQLPFLPAVLGFAMALRALFRKGVVDLRRQTGRCLACGYDLRASPDRCPECGTAATILA
jgi:hypothetical protein